MKKKTSKQNDWQLETMGGELLRWRLTEDNAHELYDHMTKAFDGLCSPEERRNVRLELTQNEQGCKIVVDVRGEIHAGLTQGDIVTICNDNSVALAIQDMYGRYYGVCIGKK